MLDSLLLITYYLAFYFDWRIMKLKSYTRSAKKGSEINTIRREGNIPAALYIKGKDAESIAINGNEFQALLRALQPGRLSTTRFTLVDEKGRERHAIVKEIQYHVTSYKVIHLDFEELVDSIPVNVKVPIECVGTADCPGVKLGGVLRQVIRYLKVRCLPKDIPDSLLVDVRDMGERDKRRLSDFVIPNNVRPLVNLNEVAIVIVKR
jgi:large subunit ribosomal protein L25